jgi:hypothetical protein
MILLWCLCACLVPGLLLLDSSVRATLADLRLHLFGVRVPVRPPEPLTHKRGTRPADPSGQRRYHSHPGFYSG